MRKSPYLSSTKRTFRQAITYLLENEYKIVGSHKVIQMMSDDIVNLHEEYYHDVDTVGPGCLVWRGTLDTGHKPPYGQRTEEEPTVTAVLPLITDEDLAELVQGCPEGKSFHEWSRERTMRRIERVVNAGLDNSTGRLLLSLSELALIFNRSISTISSYKNQHFKENRELIPIKGYIQDRGSKPTHKGQILELYEQGMAPPDIAKTTSHTLKSVDRYIKAYERVKVLLKTELTVAEISHTLGKGKRTVLEYRKIAFKHHPGLAPAG